MACVIAAPASGSGKTLLTLCLIAWARHQGKSIQPFKVGPDYLDPQLLSLSADRVCRNLDLSLCGKEWVDLSFRGFGGRCDMAVVEGVMGLFDGIGASSEGSTAAVARHLNLPVVLVVDAGRQARSLAAVVRGFQSLEPRVNLAGVVLNRVSSQRHRELLESVLDEINVPCLGSLPKDASLSLPSRHLGLAPAHELGPMQERIGRWAALASSHLNLQRFEPLLRAPAAGSDPIQTVLAPVLEQQPKRTPMPVAVAQDEAFHFRYPEMQECLEAMAMPVIPWSPLADEPPPPQALGLVLPGGFPELHAESLSQCQRSLSALQQWIAQKPLYAECGGMLMLGESLSDAEGTHHPMAGVLPFRAERGALQVGYRTLSAAHDGLILRAGESLKGHEFHRWQLSKESGDFLGKAKPLWQVDGWKISRRNEGWSLPTLHASWVHLHWAGSSTTSCRWRAALETAAKRNAAVS